MYICIHMKHLNTYIYIYPPKIYFVYPFVCPKFYQKAFCTIKKKTKKNKQKNKKQKNKTPWEISQPEFPQSFCFFLFFFGLRLLRTHFWKNTFHYLPAFGTLYFPKKTVFRKIFPAIYFKVLSLKTGPFQRAVAFFLWRPDFFKGK